jgi:hypothetical protein
MLINRPTPLLNGNGTGLRHDCNPSVASAPNFIHIPGTAIHIALEHTIHIAGIRIHRFSATTDCKLWTPSTGILASCLRSSIRRKAK